jgi:hypothetical protein
MKMKPKYNLKPLIEATKTYNRLKGIRDTERQLRYFEARAAKEIAEVLKEQRDAVLENLEQYKHYFTEEVQRDMDHIFNTVNYFTFNRFRDVIMRYRLISAKIAEDSVSSTIGMDTTFDKYDAGAYQELERTAAERVTGINEVTRDRIKKIILNGYEQKKTYAQIAREIEAEYDYMATPAPQRHVRNRAEMIAITELRDAHERSQEKMIQGFVDKGYEMEKTWLTAKDERVCDLCAANARAGWIDAHSLFPTGAYIAPQHPVCRCRTVYRVKPGTLGPAKASAGA